MESEALRKSHALLQEISRTVHCESIEVDCQSESTDWLAKQLASLTENCNIILERSRKLAETSQRGATSDIQQVNGLCSRYIAQINSQCTNLKL